MKVKIATIKLKVVGTRAFIYIINDLTLCLKPMIVDMMFICYKAADDQLGQFLKQGGIAGTLAGVKQSLPTQRAPFGTRTSK